MRMSDLADATLASRSRLSHQIDRLVKRGYVERQECKVDRRGAFAGLTDKGWKAIVAAAPDHVDSVRDNLVDVLTPQELQALGRACQKIAEHINASPSG
jgi:DNA-binding MarR family transcriptional regulator